MILLWLAWLVFVVWMGYTIYDNHRMASTHQEKKAVRIYAFLYIESVFVGNGVLRIWLDEKHLYPTVPRGFLGTGYTEAQIFFTLAWVIALYEGARWYLVNTKGNPHKIWNTGCILLILALIATALFCRLILNIPLTYNAPYL